MKNESAHKAKGENVKITKEEQNNEKINKYMTLDPSSMSGHFEGMDEKGRERGETG